MHWEQTLPADLADTVSVAMRDSDGWVVVRAGEVVLGKVPISVLHWSCALNRVSMGGRSCLWCPPAEPWGQAVGVLRPQASREPLRTVPGCPPPPSALLNPGRPPGSHQATAAWQSGGKSRMWPGSHRWSAESARNHCQRAHSRSVV